MRADTNWIPGIVVLVVGCLGALAYLVTIFLRKPSSAEQTAGLPDDLNARYQNVLNQLKEHAANKHLQEEAAWVAEKSRLEQLAVAILKQRDAEKHEALKAQARLDKMAAAPAGFFARRPMLGGALIGGGVVLFLSLSWISLNQAAKPREEMGGNQPGPMQQPAPRDDELRRLVDAVDKAPDDVDAIAQLSLHLISQQGFSEARQFVLRASLLDPFHVKTRLCRAILVAVDGDVPRALAELERLAALYPEAYPGTLYAGMLSIDQNDSARAVKNFEHYLQVAPANEVPPMLRSAIAELKQQGSDGAR